MNTDTVTSIADGPSQNLAAVVLPDRLRRRVVAELSDRTPPVPLADLAAALAECEGDGPEPPDRRGRDLETSLHHVHLPKLADAGVLDYDPVTTTVTATRTAQLGAALSDES